jgi:hypothetical protein
MTIRTPLAVLALALGAAGTLAACGDKPASSPAGSSAAPGGDAPAAAPAPAAEVKLAALTATIEAKPARAGETAHAVVRVVPSGSYHVNQEYPYKCKLDAPPEGVTYPTPVVTEVERTQDLATMKLPFVAAKPGTAKVGGLCSVSVCTDENCVIEKVALVADAKVE